MAENLEDILEVKPEGQSQVSSGGFFSFHKMISGTLIKILYVLGFIIITIAGIVLIANGSESYRGDTMILGGFALIFLGNLLWRIICEGWILLFSIHEIINEILKEIRQRKV